MSRCGPTAGDTPAGKEEQDFGSLNLGLLDFGARMYDPFTAQWTAVDLLAGKTLGVSPFAYCQNNPILLNDPTGLENVKELSEDGSDNNERFFVPYAST